MAEPISKDAGATSSIAPPSEQLAATSLSTLQELDPPRKPTESVPLSEIQNIALHASPPTVPAHRSHDASNNLKRSDPFQFGSRFLEAGDDVFEWNAWDHVDPSKDALFVEYAEKQYAFQKQNRVGDFDRKRFNIDPEKWWNKFYGNNKENFFKNRKWLRQEFPILSACTTIPESRSEAQASDESKGPAKEGEWAPQPKERLDTILEIGAGAGNTAFPILKDNQNPKLMIHACDFSKKAVELIRGNTEYNTQHIRSEVWDMASVAETLPAGVEPGSVDVVLLIFAFSALNPRQWSQAVKNVWLALRPGGEVCFRDYGRGDLAQVRFKKGRLLEENFYIRGDGTRVYFFDIEELRKIWGGSLIDALPEFETSDEAEDNAAVLENAKDAPAFEVLALAADRRLLVNRDKKLKMYRCWMQGRFRKPPAAEG